MKQGAILVTGGNSGIGYECARRLAREPRAIVIASRDRAASAAAVERIRRETGNPDVSEMALDLGSFAAIRAFAAEIAARDVPLHAIVCNAGLQTSGKTIVRSADGFERTFAVNHLGHFLLVNLLLRRLAGHTPARIMIVASGVHDPKLRTGMPKPAVGHFDVLAQSGGPRPDAFDARVAYVNSKLCNLWFTYELIRRIVAAGLTSKERPISVNAFEPGLVPGSGLAREYPAALRWVWLTRIAGGRQVRDALHAGHQSGRQGGRGARRAGARSLPRAHLGQVLSVARSLGRSAVVGSVVRRDAGGGALGGERALHAAHARRVAARSLMPPSTHENGADVWVREELLSLLSVAGTLAGLSVTVVALMHTLGTTNLATTVIDDLFALCGLLFLVCTYVIFAALRLARSSAARALIRTADALFLVGLTLMTAAGFMMVYTVW